MGRKFKLENNWYAEGERIYNRVNIELKPGLTVLVGCNGSGKTTMLEQIKDELRSNKTPFLNFDNLQDGGSNARSEALYRGNYDFLFAGMTSSEGENIMLNVGNIASELRSFITTGKRKKRNPFEGIFDDKKEASVQTKERWILMDAVDSGLSIDNMSEVRDFFDLVLSEEGYDIYIVVSTNSYEIARDADCFDVRNGRYVTFGNYEEYRSFILDSRKSKDKRYEVFNQKRKEQKEKESKDDEYERN